MKKVSLITLRISLGLSFLIIGIMIWRDPVGWVTFISGWAVMLLPVSVMSFMQFIGILDFVMGIFLIFGILTPWVALLAVVHLLGILVTSDPAAFNTTVRDIGLMGASLALFLETRQKK